MAKNNLTNIQLYQKKKNINIGLVLFGVIFIYLVITILAYVTAKHVSVYEVREGSILKDTSFTGIIIREEQVIKSDSEGYVNYFVTEGSKVGSKSNVYSISKNKLDLDSVAAPESEETETSSDITSEEQSEILQLAETFTDSYRSESYNAIYNLKDSIYDIVQNNSTDSRQAKLETLLQTGSEDLNVYTAVDDGIIVYSIDGYEDLTLNKTTEDIINKTDYKNTELSNNTLIYSGDPVYKLITSDEWTVGIELDDDMADQLIEKPYIKVRFTKDGKTEWASLKVINTKNSNIGFLTFDKSMIRYATDRFIDIELILEDQSGLKIPKSSVIQKEFYCVPGDYITRGGNSNQTGILVQGDKNSVEFESADVYYRDAETDLCYIDTASLKAGTTILKPDSGDSYELREKDTLNGVYNVNKGYAIFRYVDILSESEEYYIIASGSSYGLSNYDHIALDGTSINEKDIVF